MSLDKYRGRLDIAARDMAKAVNEAFPVGCRVAVEWGRGWMYGVVAHATREATNTCEDVSIRTDAGKVHHKHYSQVQRVAQ